MFFRTGLVGAAGEETLNSEVRCGRMDAGDQQGRSHFSYDTRS
jgi:hypothetical protein